ncbi:MAG: TadE/TadG family type IV pilus assembly protein [Thermodesulfobacteriota bacterium]
MKLRDQKGAAAVEFALVLPILILFIFGIIEFGMGMHAKEILTNASREGARAGIVAGDPRPTESQIIDVVKTYLTNAALDVNKAEIKVSGAGGTPGSYLTVQVQYPYKFEVLPGFMTDFAGDITLTGRTVMRTE